MNPQFKNCHLLAFHGVHLYVFRMVYECFRNLLPRDPSLPPPPQYAVPSGIDRSSVYKGYAYGNL